MRGTEHFKRHLSVITWRQDNGGPVEKISEVQIEDPFHRTKVVIDWTFWGWLRMLFSRRQVEIVVHVRSDGVSQGRWFQGADICEKCKRNRVDGPTQPMPGCRESGEVWCDDCCLGIDRPAVATTLSEAVKAARGGDAPPQRQGYA